MSCAVENSVGAGPLHLRTKVLTAGKTATGIEITDELIAKLAAGRKPAVKRSTALPTAAQWRS